MERPRSSGGSRSGHKPSSSNTTTTTTAAASTNSDNSSNNNASNFKARRDELDSLLLSAEVDICRLRVLSREPGGFMDRQLRARVWPKLVGVSLSEVIGTEEGESFDFGANLDLETHKDAGLVKNDVLRSLWSVDVTLEWDDTLRERRRLVMRNIILTILKKNRQLHYYQGYHDIVSVILLVLEDDMMTLALSERISLEYLSDFMQVDFDVAVVPIMKLIHGAICYLDPKLKDFFEGVEAFYCTSWLLTWLSHDIRCLDTVSRLFDVLLASPPYFIVYLCSALVLHHRDDILLSVDRDPSMVHQHLCKLTERESWEGLMEDIIAKADHLMILSLPIDKLLGLVKVQDPEFYKDIQKRQVGLFRGLSSSQLAEKYKDKDKDKDKDKSKGKSSSSSSLCSYSSWRALELLFRRRARVYPISIAPCLEIEENDGRIEFSGNENNKSNINNINNSYNTYNSNNSNNSNNNSDENATGKSSLLHICSKYFMIGSLLGCSIYFWHKNGSPINS